MLRFYSYRISLVEPSQRSSLKSTGLVKEEVFFNLVQRLHQQQKIPFIAWGTKHIMFFIKRVSNTLYYLELAKEETYKKPVEGEHSIEEVEDTRAPFIYLILDTRRQIILIQDKKAVFQNFEVAKSRIETFFDEQLEYIGLNVLLKPITNKNDFWKEIESLDEINDFGVTLNAPNLFKGRFKANEFVKETHEEYNFTEFKLWFKSKIGKLTLYRENAEEFIALAAAGGGKYVVRAMKEGKRVIIDSLNFIVQKVYNVDDIKELDEGRMNGDLDELDKMNEDD